MSKPSEQRRIRFHSLGGLDRTDIELACEIWLSDVCEAKWASREAMKLAAYMARYIVEPDERGASVARMESQAQLTRDDLNAALRVLKLYRAVQDYTIQGDEVRVALLLSHMLRLRVLEARHALEQLARPGADLEDDHWVPEHAPKPAAAPRSEAA